MSTYAQKYIASLEVRITMRKEHAVRALEELRDHLTALSGLERPQPAPERKKTPLPSDPTGPYVPGIAPSW